jgi:hypothetical protein
MRRLILFIAPLGVPLLLAGGAFAFMGANNVPVTHAGTGQGAITGYNVTNVTYAIDGPNNKVTGIDFDLDGIATDLSVQFNHGSGNYYAVSGVGGCNVTPFSGGTHVHCNLNEPLEAVDGLMISAEQFI